MEKTVFWIFFYIILFIPIMVYLIYCCNVITQQYYRFKNIFEKLDEYTKKYINKNELGPVIKMLFDRVNGWCILKAIYTSVHFCFNFWSIAYAVLGLGFDNVVEPLYIKVCAIISILTLSLNLFLKSEKKWMTFKKVWISGSIQTNQFIVELSNDKDDKDICVITEEYSNSILDIEESLGGDDII